MQVPVYYKIRIFWPNQPFHTGVVAPTYRWCGVMVARDVVVFS